MISELLPDDIQNLILSLWSEKYPDEDMDKMLPPRFVREAMLAEKGIMQQRGQAQLELVRDWFKRQAEIQTEAMKIQEALQKSEPMTEELARKGELPSWSVQPWAITLMFDWSAYLGDAVAEAKMYLVNK